MASLTTAIQGGQTVQTPGDTGVTKGVFITPESLTFPAAAAICSAVLGGLNLFIANAARSPLVVLAVCILIGAFIIAAGWPGKGSSRREVMLYLGTGVLNIFLLFTSVIGVAAAATQQAPSLPGV